MAAGIGLVLKIAADTKKAVGDIKGVNRALEGTGTQTKTTTKMMGAMKGVGIAALGGVAVGAVALADAFVDMGKAAWEDHQEQKRLAETLKKFPGITQDMIAANEEWIESAMWATHVSDTELRQAVSDLMLATEDLTLAQEYAAAAADLATVADVDYATAVEAVQGALDGKTRGLMGLAPHLDKNKDGTLDLAEAQAILTDKVIDGAAEAKAAEDPWGTLQILWGELQEGLGAAFIPLLEDLAKWFKDPENQAKLQHYIDKIGEWSRTLGTKLLPYLDRFLDWLVSPEGQQAMRDVAHLVKAIADAFLWIAKAFSDIAGAWRNLPEPLKKLLKFMPGAGIFGVIDKITPGAAAFSGSSPAVAGFASPTAYTRPVTINFNGTVTDPEGTARAIARTIAASDLRNGRPRRLEPAW